MSYIHILYRTNDDESKQYTNQYGRLNHTVRERESESNP